MHNFQTPALSIPSASRLNAFAINRSNFIRAGALAVIMLLIVTLSACGGANNGNNGKGKVVKGLPWQITTFDDGSSEVFGLRIGHTTLAQASSLIKGEMQSAIIVDQQNKAGLEMYFKHYKAGVLDGKLVIVADLTEAELQQMIGNLEQGDYMASGARKLVPTDADWSKARQAKIASIAFIPSINLDEDIILNRFGKKPQIVSLKEVKHFLYAESGLDVVLSEDGKEVLQYVAPKAFEQLRQPLIYAAELANQGGVK